MSFSKPVEDSHLESYELGLQKMYRDDNTIKDMVLLLYRKGPHRVTLLTEASEE